MDDRKVNHEADRPSDLRRDLHECGEIKFISDITSDGSIFIQRVHNWKLSQFPKIRLFNAVFAFRSSEIDRVAGWQASGRSSDARCHSANQRACIRDVIATEPTGARDHDDVILYFTAVKYIGNIFHWYYPSHALDKNTSFPTP